MIESSVSPWYSLQLHEEGQSPYAYTFAGEDLHWIEEDSYFGLTLMKQIDTVKMNKHSHSCNEDNQNHFMHCVEDYYSKRLGCVLPWSTKESHIYNAGNVCKGKEKFREFKNISLNIWRPEGTKGLIKEGCFIQNCQKQSWDMKKEKYTEFTNISAYYVDMYKKPKVLVRREVKLYTLINFFAEVGGYLGLLLGESLVSYIFVISKWVHLIGKKLKEKCKKEAEEPSETPNQRIK